MAAPTALLRGYGDMNMQTIDPRHFRSVMGAFPTGVAIVATEWKGELFGATINSLTSVSLTPCMLLFCTNEGSATGAAIRKRGMFSVNILGHHQSELSARFTAGRRTGSRTLPSRTAPTTCRSSRAPPLNSAAGSPRSTRRATTISFWVKCSRAVRSPAIRWSFTRAPTGYFNALDLNSLLEATASEIERQAILHLVCVVPDLSLSLRCMGLFSYFSVRPPAYPAAFAAARPAFRPENRQPPRNVPSSER